VRNTETSRNGLLLSFIEMSQLSFNHLLHLSFAWHTKRKTGEVLRVLDRGSAINDTFRVRTFFYSYLIVVALTSLVALAIRSRPGDH
jgi:ABC-type transport system involved in Fe-S cluster assembly fused permease/ATPase subunit